MAKHSSDFITTCGCTIKMAMSRFYVPGHFTSIKYELGLCTNLFSLCFRFSDSGVGCNKSTCSCKKMSTPRVTIEQKKSSNIQPLTTPKQAKWFISIETFILVLFAAINIAQLTGMITATSVTGKRPCKKWPHGFV